MSVLRIDEILATAKVRRGAGFALVAGPSVAGRAARMFRAFLTPPGAPTETGEIDGELQWVVCPPEPGALSSFSTHVDERGACFVEGDFYPPPPNLPGNAFARWLLERVLNKGPAAIDVLNGLFCGAVWSRQDRTLWLFVDRLGCRFFYYRATADRIEAATDLYGFRHADPRPTVDAQALNEHLAIGYPTEGKTLFSGIRLVPSASVVEWSAKGIRIERYYQEPDRIGGQSLVEGAEMICAALDRHVRTVVPEHPGIALSAGKDSRVVLGALLRAGHRPSVFTFHARAERRNVERLASRLGLEVHTRAHEGETMAFDLESALLQDGYGAGTGFLALAFQARLHTRTLYTGFLPDILSGSWAGLWPPGLTSPDALARGVAVREEVALQHRALLRPKWRVPAEDVWEAWLQSMRREYCGDLVTTFLRHKLGHRYRRRVAMIFHMMRIACGIVHPVADRRVMDAYLSLPLESLKSQAAHQLAAMAGHPVLGQIPAGSSRVPLKYEAAWTRWIEPLRQISRQARRLRAARATPARPTDRHLRFRAMAVESGLFEYETVQVLSAKAVKVGATALHVGWMLGQPIPSAPAPNLRELNFYP